MPVPVQGPLQSPPWLLALEHNVHVPIYMLFTCGSPVLGTG